MDFIVAIWTIVSFCRDKNVFATYLALTLLSSGWSTLSDFTWPVPHRMSDLAFIVLIWFIFYNKLHKKKWLNLSSTQIVLWVFLVINTAISCMIALSNGIPLTDMFKTLRYLLGAYLAFYLISGLTFSDIKQLLYYIEITNLLLCFFIFIQFFFNISILKYHVQDISSTMGTYGIYPPFTLLLTLLLLLSGFQKEKFQKGIEYWLHYLNIIFCYATSLLCMIRSFLFSIIFVTLTFFVLRIRKTFFIIILCSGFVCFFFNQDMANRLLSEDHSSHEFRMEYLEYAWKYCRDQLSPWGGELQSISLELEDYYSNDIKTRILDSSDICAKILFRQGWLGSLSYLLLIFLPPLLLKQRLFSSPLGVALLLYTYIYLPISLLYSDLLLRPYALVCYLLLFYAIQKVPDEKISEKTIQRKREESHV